MLRSEEDPSCNMDVFRDNDTTRERKSPSFFLSKGPPPILLRTGDGPRLDYPQLRPLSEPCLRDSLSGEESDDSIGADHALIFSSTMSIFLPYHITTLLSPIEYFITYRSRVCMLFAVFDHADCIGDIGYFFALLSGCLGVYPSGIYETCHLST